MSEGHTVKIPALPEEVTRERMLGGVSGVSEEGKGSKVSFCDKVVGEKASRVFKVTENLVGKRWQLCVNLKMRMIYR
ncbi:hypothetical protein PIB30_057081, partial [Stylosanthes scabra]|nr:hypothetical protein [Stylosanthes scabra]